MSEQSDSTIEPLAESSVGGDGTVARPTELQHVTVEHDEEIAVCTMFPRALSEEDVSSQWLTATGESFVDLEDAR